MAWFAGLGVAVVGFFSSTAAAALSTGVAMAIGGAIVGAGVGALYSLATDGNILEGALYGALGGAAIGYGASALGLGAVAPEMSAVQYGVSGGQVLGAQTATNAASSTLTVSNMAQGAAGSLFTTKEGWGTIGGAMSLGSAFLKGGSQLDPDAALAFKEDEAAKDRASAQQIASERNATTLEAASMNLAATRENIASSEKLSFANLEQSKEQYNKEFNESRWRDREDRAEIERGRLRFEAGVAEGSKFVKANTQKVSLVESSRRRKTLPGPSWWNDTGNESTTQQQESATDQPQSTGIVSSASGATA